MLSDDQVVKEGFKPLRKVSSPSISALTVLADLLSVSIGVNWICCFAFTIKTNYSFYSALQLLLRCVSAAIATTDIKT